MGALPFREHVESHSLLKAVGSVTGLRVLDLGCGTGVYARHFRACGALRVVGMDSAAAMVEYARAFERREQRPITYVHRDATRPLNGIHGLAGAFDLVVAVYLLAFAASEDELAALCATARQALPPQGGRFILITLHPDFAHTPGWYRAYGMTLTSVERRREEGERVRLTAWVDGRPIALKVHRWSAAAYERALAQAGFLNITWIRPEVSEAGRRWYGERFWSRYLTLPHALIVDATTGPGEGGTVPEGDADNSSCGPAPDPAGTSWSMPSTS
ncbi:class I SAM-dependent methyltransferase [Streptomyces roseoverticillatus]|uniref:class I SAM-dependent methyltransferase n=1 Tax=Streptomyces roseoverticillatus TaxID=66429 RepID=UPI0033CA5005